MQAAQIMAASARERSMNQPLTFDRPLSTVDVTIFCMRQQVLMVLLVRRPHGDSEPYPGQWALPGGFVDVAHDIDLEGCALRKLKEKTGVCAPYLEQLGSWGSATRDPRGWAATHVYLALLAGDDPDFTPGGNAQKSLGLRSKAAACVRPWRSTTRRFSKPRWRDCGTRWNPQVPIGLLYAEGVHTRRIAACARSYPGSGAGEKGISHTHSRHGSTRGGAAPSRGSEPAGATVSAPDSQTSPLFARALAPRATT